VDPQNNKSGTSIKLIIEILEEKKRIWWQKFASRRKKFCLSKKEYLPLEERINDL
jgi:hypothetical protein